MSVFKVSLTNTTGGAIINPSQGQVNARLTGQGGLDEAAQAAANHLSVQRTMFAPGPKKIMRKLIDGATFTDCNYWKRFAFPQVPTDQAFITVVTDDGSTYIDGQINTAPRVYTVAVAAGSTFAGANLVNVLSDNGGPAFFTQITVAGNAVNCKINGNVNAILPIAAGTTQIFNQGDVQINTLDFQNNASGAVNATVTVLVSTQSICNS